MARAWSASCPANETSLARNAGLLAVRILAAAEGPTAEALRARLVSFAGQLADQARAKGAALRDRGPVNTEPA